MAAPFPPPAMPVHRVLRTSKLTVPQTAAQSGFDVVRIQPVSGDGFYCMGHMNVYE